VQPGGDCGEVGTEERDDESCRRSPQTMPSLTLNPPSFSPSSTASTQLLTPSLVPQPALVQPAASAMSHLHSSSPTQSGQNPNRTPHGDGTPTGPIFGHRLPSQLPIEVMFSQIMSAVQQSVRPPFLSPSVAPPIGI